MINLTMSTEAQDKRAITHKVLSSLSLSASFSWLLVGDSAHYKLKKIDYGLFQYTRQIVEYYDVLNFFSKIISTPDDELFYTYSGLCYLARFTSRITIVHIMEESMEEAMEEGSPFDGAKLSIKFYLDKRLVLKCDTDKLEQALLSLKALAEDESSSAEVALIYELEKIV